MLKMSHYDTPRKPSRRLVPRCLKPILDASETVPDTIWWDDEYNEVKVPRLMPVAEEKEKKAPGV